MLIRPPAKDTVESWPLGPSKKRSFARVLAAGTQPETKFRAGPGRWGAAQKRSFWLGPSKNF